MSYRLKSKYISFTFEHTWYAQGALPIQIRDRELKRCGEGDPGEVRDVGESDPLHILADSEECPDEGREAEQDVEGGEEIVLEGELEVGEREIEDEVQSKRQSKHGRHFPLPCFIKDHAEGDSDEDIEQSPHWAEEPRGRCPLRLDQCRIPVVGGHARRVAVDFKKITTEEMMMKRSEEKNATEPLVIE